MVSFFEAQIGFFASLVLLLLQVSGKVFENEVIQYSRSLSCDSTEYFDGEICRSCEPKCLHPPSKRFNCTSYCSEKKKGKTANHHLIETTIPISTTNPEPKTMTEPSTATERDIPHIYMLVGIVIACIVVAVGISVFSCIVSKKIMNSLTVDKKNIPFGDQQPRLEEGEADEIKYLNQQPAEISVDNNQFLLSDTAEPIANYMANKEVSS